MARFLVCVLPFFFCQIHAILGKVELLNHQAATLHAKTKDQPCELDASDKRRQKDIQHLNL